MCYIISYHISYHISWMICNAIIVIYQSMRPTNTRYTRSCTLHTTFLYLLVCVHARVCVFVSCVCVCVCARARVCVMCVRVCVCARARARARACIKHIHIPNPQARVHAHRRKWYTRSMIGPFAVSDQFQPFGCVHLHKDSDRTRYCSCRLFMHLICSCALALHFLQVLKAFYKSLVLFFLNVFGRKFFQGCHLFL